MHGLSSHHAAIRVRYHDDIFLLVINEVPQLVLDAFRILDEADRWQSSKAGKLRA